MALSRTQLLGNFSQGGCGRTQAARARSISFSVLSFFTSAFEGDYPYTLHDAYDNMYVLLEHFPNRAAAVAARNDRLFVQTAWTNEALFLSWVYTFNRESQGPSYNAQMTTPVLIAWLADTLHIEAPAYGSRTLQEVVYDCFHKQRRLGRWGPSKDLEATTMYNKLLELLKIAVFISSLFRWSSRARRGTPFISGPSGMAARELTITWPL